MMAIGRSTHASERFTNKSDPHGAPIHDAPKGGQVWQYPLHGERTFLWLMALDKWKFPFSERVVPSGLQQRQQEIPSSICSKVLLSSDVYWSSRIASSSNLDTAPSIIDPSDAHQNKTTVTSLIGIRRGRRRKPKCQSNSFRWDQSGIS